MLVSIRSFGLEALSQRVFVTAIEISGLGRERIMWSVFSASSSVELTQSTPRSPARKHLSGSGSKPTTLVFLAKAPATAPPALPNPITVSYTHLTLPTKA